MLRGSLAFASALLLSLALTPWAASLGRRLGAVDRALDLRKTHAGSVSRLGGVAIVAGWLAGLAVAMAAGGGGLAGRRSAAIALGGLLVAGVGVADDLRGLSPRVKLAGQVLAALAAYSAGLRIDAVALPFGATLPLGDLAVPAAVLWMVGAANALNLIDGLDGLAAGVAATAAFGMVAAHGGADPLLAVSGAAVAGASLGFLRHNLRPSCVFMGDGGSLFLGFVLAASALPAASGARGEMPLLPPLLALAVPVTDAFLALLRRLARGAPVAGSDREHLHHLLLDRGFSRGSTSLVLVGASALHAGAALAVARSSASAAAGIVVALAALDLAGLRALGFMRKGLWRRTAESRERNLALRGAVRRARAGLRGARDLVDVGSVLSRAGPALGAARVRLDRSGEADGPLTVPDAAGGLWSRHPVRGRRSGDDAVLLLGWGAGRALDRPTEIAVEQLCGALSSALRRLERRPLRAGLLPVPRQDES